MFLTNKTNWHCPANRNGRCRCTHQENIDHHLHFTRRTEAYQAVAVKIKIFHNEEVTLTSLYCHPKHYMPDDEFISLFNHQGTKFICGDYNAKHPHWGSCSKRKLRLDVVSPFSPTYWPKHTINNLYKICSTIAELSSDHVPIIQILDTIPLNSKRENRLTNKSTNWNKFDNIIDKEVDLNIKLKSQFDIDYITDMIQNCCKKSTRPVKPTVGNCNVLPIEIRELICKRRKACKKWQRHRYPSNYQTSRQLCKQLK